MRITIDDVILAGFCPAGVYRWFKDHGFTREEFRVFLAEGLPAEELRARGDGLAQVVADRKIQREAAHGRR